MAKQTVVVKDFKGQGVIRTMPKSRNFFMRFKIYSQKGWTAWRTTRASTFEDASRIATEEYKKITDHVEGAKDGTVDLTRVYDEFTFEGVAHQWLEEYIRCANNGLKPAGSSKKASVKQIPDHTKHIERYIHEFFGLRHKKVKINRVTESLLKDYIEWRRTYYTEGPGKDVDTISVERNGKTYQHKVKHKEMELPSGAMGMINSIFEFALRRGIITATQRPDVPKPVQTLKDKKKSRRPAFSGEHWKALLEGMPLYIAAAPRDKEKRARQNLSYYILVMAEMGIRPGKEHSQIQWKHVEFEEDADTGIEIAILSIHENTKGGSRPVVVAPHGTALLKKLKEWTDFADDEDFIFANPVNGTAVIRFDSSFNNLLKFLKLTHTSNGKKYAPYSLRHTYATRSREFGLSDHIIAMNMGHENETMVQQVYGQDGIKLHKGAIIDADRKRNPSKDSSLARSLMIKTVIDAAQNSGLLIEKEGDNSSQLEIVDGDIKVIN